MNRIDRRRFFHGAAAAATTIAGYGGIEQVTAQDRKLGTCGPPPRKNPLRHLAKSVGVAKVVASHILPDCAAGAVDLACGN